MKAGSYRDLFWGCWIQANAKILTLGRVRLIDNMKEFRDPLADRKSLPIVRTHKGVFPADSGQLQ